MNISSGQFSIQFSKKNVNTSKHKDFERIGKWKNLGKEFAWHSFAH